MKITLDLPDNTIGANVNFVYYMGSWLALHGRIIDSKELFDGSVIKIEAAKQEEEK